jgi:branched-chain amino acid transport system substrate-binding protein
MRWSATWTAIVTGAGGKVLGKVRHPFPGQDFSSFLLQAQASKAKVIGLANAGGDTINSIKQAAEFGINKGGQSLAGLLVFVTDVHSLGLPTAQGLLLTESFYWDLRTTTPAPGPRILPPPTRGACRRWCRPASMASVMHYLKAVAGHEV